MELDLICTSRKRGLVLSNPDVDKKDESNSYAAYTNSMNHVLSERYLARIDVGFQFLEDHWQFFFTLFLKLWPNLLTGLAFRCVLYVGVIPVKTSWYLILSRQSLRDCNWCFSAWVPPFSCSVYRMTITKRLLSWLSNLLKLKAFLAVLFRSLFMEWWIRSASLGAGFTLCQAAKRNLCAHVGIAKYREQRPKTETLIWKTYSSPPGKWRTMSLNFRHSVAVHTSVWACPKLRMRVATLKAVSISGARKMSR